MEKFLVIVESPSKAKTINKYLGSNYIVKSSLGHVRDLPSNNLIIKKNISSSSVNKKKVHISDTQSILLHRIGIDPNRDWQAKYEILPGKEKIIHELNILARKSDHVYLATDLDREGEAIAWHLKEVLQLNTEKYSRVVFNEITYSAIVRAFKHPTILNINRVYAQQARRFMDRIVGYMLSPLLWEKIARGLSAGRVQSVVVRLIVEREREIKKFIPKEYWELYAHVNTKSGEKLKLRVTHDDQGRFMPASEDDILVSKNLLLQSSISYVIADRKDKDVFVKPDPPFTTSTLQQASSLYFGYSIKKTMLLAQRLYEAGYITYVRTNSTNISEDSLKILRSYIHDVFGELYLSQEQNKYISKSFNQEAHEAIRPSDVYLLPELLSFSDVSIRKLYHLIWCRFVASQMVSYKYCFTIFKIQAGNFILSVKGRMLCFDGWKKAMFIYTNKYKQEDIFPNIKIGDILTLDNISFKQCFTKPPRRYTEASLVKKLEKMGIGRPSTYVPIISTIQYRGYVYIYDNYFYATKIGEIVTDRLLENFCDLMDYKFTANMEDILDQISDNKIDWKSVLNDFYFKFTEKLNLSKKDCQEGGMRPNSIVITSIVCKTCGKRMGIRTAVTGVFLSCSGYNDFLVPKQRCKYTVNLIPDMSDSVDKNIFRCRKCNDIMNSYFINSRKKLHICMNNPSCDGYIVEHGIFTVQDLNNTVIICEKCNNTMYLKFGRFGKYMICSNISCKNTRTILSDGRVISSKSPLVLFPELVCKKSDAYFVLRNGNSGIFLAAHTFPRSRETRAPLVEELVRFRERLPEQLVYLADGPICDDDGNKTIVRFSKKTQEQYIVSECNGKLTSWKSFFINGHWQVQKN